MTDPDVVESTTAEPEDSAKCRICNGGGDADDWVGCDAPQCEYWIHLSCVGITMKPGVQKKRFMQKIDYKCPRHK